MRMGVFVMYSKLFKVVLALAIVAQAASNSSGGGKKFSLPDNFDADAPYTDRTDFLHRADAVVIVAAGRRWSTPSLSQQAFVNLPLDRQLGLASLLLEFSEHC
jgi:hypothetical protein